MSITHAANPGRHSLAARKDDLYETPSEAVWALLRVESCRNLAAVRHPIEFWKRQPHR
jgi:hypothetical protein